MSAEERSSKGILGPFEKIGLIVILLVLAFLAFQRGGFKLAERTEEVTITDNPHPDYERREKPVYRPPAADPAVDEVLERIADQFSQQPRQSTGKELKNMGLSNDEAEYLNDVREDHELDQTLQNARDWYNLLRASHQTYGRVKALFESIDPAAVKNEDLGSVQHNEQLQDQVSELFDIPESQVRAFARQGRKALSDWAEFVEENKKKDPR